MNWNLAQPLHDQSRLRPRALALAADGVELDYAALVAEARKLAGHLAELGLAPGSRIAILGSRSRLAVTAVLGTFWAGMAYVPLGLKWPEARLLSVLGQARPAVLICDERGAARLTPAIGAAVRHVLPPAAIAGLRDPGPGLAPAGLPPAAIAYVIFTSGTTGEPKGVVVRVDSVASYVAALQARKQMTPTDRASQFTELSFDPSIGEILVPFGEGASMHVVPDVATMSPARFIADRRLTIWGAAPSAIAWMASVRALRPGAFPALRYSSFGGEPLPLRSVQAWRTAAPNSAVDNLYGPTEATVDCLGQLVPPGAAPVVTPGRDILAIGRPHPGIEARVIGPDRQELPLGEVGELAIAGVQVAAGYLDRPELTAARFPVFDGRRWYLTGDLACRDAAGLFHHLGRADNQIKIAGQRVEIEDVEAHLRAVAGSDAAAVIAWPVRDGVALGLVGFVAGGAADPTAWREALRGRLPPPMVPAVIHRVENLPLTAHRKIDREALAAIAAARQPA